MGSLDTSRPSSGPTRDEWSVSSRLGHLTGRVLDSTYTGRIKGSVLIFLVINFLFLAVLEGDAVSEAAGYSIYRAGTPITVDGRLDEPAWTAAPDVGAFVFPWYENGKKEQTVAKMLWDDENLYAAFICEDAHIWAEHT